MRDEQRIYNSSMTYNDRSHNWGKDHSSRDGSDKKRAATLGVTAEAAKTEREDSCEAALWDELDQLRSNRENEDKGKYRGTYRFKTKHHNKKSNGS
jgi:hypothetical protein